MTGKVAADIVKPVPLSVAELMVTGAVPVEVNVTGSVDAVFTVTLPNAKLAGLIVNCGLATTVPVPLRLTTPVLLVDESLWIVSWPDAAPVTTGSNCTLSVTDWPGFKVTGNVAPDIVSNTGCSWFIESLLDVHRRGPARGAGRPACRAWAAGPGAVPVRRAAVARELLAEGSGGIGYLLKDRVMDSAGFVNAVRRVAGGGTAMDPEVISRLLVVNAGDGTLAALGASARCSA